MEHEFVLALAVSSKSGRDALCEQYNHFFNAP